MLQAFRPLLLLKEGALLLYLRLLLVLLCLALVSPKHMLLILVPSVQGCPLVGIPLFPFPLLQLDLRPCLTWLVDQLRFKGSPSELDTFLVRILL